MNPGESSAAGTVSKKLPRTGTSIVRLATWAALLLGAIGSATSANLSLAVAAAVCGLAFAAAISFLRLEEIGSNFTTYAVVGMGAIVTAAAVTLTGGVGSAYMLLAIMPGLFAAMVGGFLPGLITSLLASGLIGTIAFSTSDAETVLSGLATLGLFPLMAIVVAQIRALLLEAEARATALARATEVAEAELAVLSQTNDLLRRLTDLYGEGDSNPVAVGRTVLEAIVDTFPGSFATATLFDGQGPVVVARAGTDAAALHRTQFPLGDGSATSGVVSLGTSTPLSDEDRASASRLLRPLSVSFANAILLQRISREAVREERLRLARELHDEVGPSLAALGLALDGLSMQEPETEVSRELAGVREGLSVVVDDLRGIIADLRSEESGSITRAIAGVVAPLQPPPTIAIEIRERHTPPSSVTRQLVAVVTEAVRNAHRHAEAQSVEVSGTVERQRAELEVTDDGKGFDLARIPAGHFGVMGMQERADRIGAKLRIDTSNRGTRLAIVWKEQP
jgi:signal transduction histidine kinase